MIAGRHECEGEDWKAEYWGYLMSEWYAHKSKKTSICMDNAPETATNGSTGKNQAYVFPVEGICGALPCPPFVNQQELTCVVCSK